MHTGSIDRKWGKGTADRHRDIIRGKINQKFLDQQKKKLKAEVTETQVTESTE